MINNEQPSSPSGSGLALASMIRSCGAVIFDLDGTLVDSLWVWDRVDSEFYEKYKINPSAELLKELDTVDFGLRARTIKEAFGLEPSPTEIKTEWLQNAAQFYTDKVRLKPKAKEFIHWLAEHGIPMAVATANTFSLATKCLEANGVLDKFSAIKAGSMVKRSKPFPDVYLAAAEALEVSPERCIVFEDSVIGITGANNAGIPAVLVRDEGSRASWGDLASRSLFGIDDYTELVDALMSQAAPVLTDVESGRFQEPETIKMKTE